MQRACSRQRTSDGDHPYGNINVARSQADIGPRSVVCKSCHGSRAEMLISGILIRKLRSTRSMQSYANINNNHI